MACAPCAVQRCCQRATSCCCCGACCCAPPTWPPACWARHAADRRTGELVWPPAGLAFAALLRFGPRLWPAVAIGAFIVASSTGLILWVAALVALGNAGGMAAAATALRHHGLHPALDRRIDLKLLALGAVGATVLTATNGVTGCCSAAHCPGPWHCRRGRTGGWAT
ncbi:hypothetical protein FSC37_08445 [Piscinibacter aquaticus]|uniref:MASE1 domain-containing protein n=1 Tax=Piscinibacter aquaticus TaxID=392597 RepID=A0A5C6TZD9_9BURK|nr:hypothetical protein FSC37_08445 [Piscinibacter aquaticus]